jgi:hypothetical protein
MRCKYLNLFKMSRLDWSVISCMANDRPYTPSISELHYYCKGEEYTKCPVLIKKDYTGEDTPCPEVDFLQQCY